MPESESITWLLTEGSFSSQGENETGADWCHKNANLITTIASGRTGPIGFQGDKSR